MKTTILRSSLTALACTAVLAIASTSMAANVNLKADLKASARSHRPIARAPVR